MIDAGNQARIQGAALVRMNGHQPYVFVVAYRPIEATIAHK